ncbi:hypothetical protein L208DRAFT_1377849 [Tricholoma matsutake]|nr:hypothetical protein L208DRAFT_1377849 [Tricholoma matsutake 945]
MAGSSKHWKQLFHLKDPEDTSESYLSFTTKYQPPQDYETLLIAASKVCTQGTKSFDRREPMETGLVQSGFAVEAYTLYIIYEHRARNPDLFVMSGIYECAIAEVAKQQFEGDAGAEETLRMFWMDAYVRVNYFLVCYGPIEAMFHTLGWPKIIDKQVLDVMFRAMLRFISLFILPKSVRQSTS